MNIYFSGAIAGGRQKQGSYKELISFCKQYGIVFNECVGKKNIRVHKSMNIYERNMDWVEDCDVFIAEITVPSFGVGMEIERAIKKGIPILCLFDMLDMRPTSKMITNCQHITLIGYSNIENAKKAVAEFVEKIKLGGIREGLNEPIPISVG